MTDSFSCPACGAPNEPAAGAAQMACTYCGANLTIPPALRRAARPTVESTPAKVAPAATADVEASDLLRKAQPVAIGALNAYAAWTWVRNLLPACLVIVLVGLCACGLLTVLPIWLRR